MKKLISCLAVLALMMSSISGAFALNFTGELGNEATFETLQEAHASSPAVVQGIVENEYKTFVGHPALDGYPEGTTFVYRSANQYAGRAAARLNTNIFVYAEQRFETKDAALAYLKDAGLIDIIDEAIGSVVLVTPVGDTFGQADVLSYYALQTAMLSQKAGGMDADGNAVYYSDAEYFGGYGNEYFVGIEGGATFFNNYIAPEIDFVGRLAGVLLIGGDMQEARKPAVYVPISLINAQADVVEKYKAINAVDASKTESNGVVTYYNQAWPLRKVITASMASVDVAKEINTAYYGLFVKAMRVPVIPEAMNSGGGLYSGYTFDEAPYSLCDRNILINGRTSDGIVLISHQGDDTFKDIKTTEEVAGRGGAPGTPAGEYIDVWYEYLPEEVLDNTAPAGSIPLILANHGGGDDARVFAEEFGLVELAGKERVAVVAPDHSTVGAIRGQALTAVAEYMLAKYPALDASRVYATGYSMGGGATYTVGYYNPKLFAAIAPFAGSNTVIPAEQEENFYSTELPIIMSLSSFDPAGRRQDALEGNLNEGTQLMISTYAKSNGIEVGAFDFETYPHVGFGGDYSVVDTVNGEFEKKTTYLCNSDGEPRVAYVYVNGMVHCLYPEYAFMLWDYVKNYSRDLTTGEIVYAPY
ncbi:MAG TPA: hypothetical protein PKU80_00125 [Candidatus Limiplasma sp.]|nr:hypothetical protein [Candidatus Limiplasma sp.]